MSETLMTDAAIQPNDAVEQVEAAPVEAGQEAVTEQAQQEAGQPKGEDAAKPSSEAGEYKIEAPEDAAFDSRVLDAYTEIAKELKLPQDAAQKMLEKISPIVKERQSQQIAEVHNAWAETAKSDKEFGGDRLNENLAVARKALDAFGTTDLRVLLNETGLGNHPELIRFMVRAGRAISSDTFVGGTAAASKTATGPKGFNDFAASLYPNQK